MTEYSRKVKKIQKQWRDDVKAIRRKALRYTPQRSPWTMGRAERLKGNNAVPSRYRTRPKRLKL